MEICTNYVQKRLEPQQYYHGFCKSSKVKVLEWKTMEWFAISWPNCEFEIW